MVIILIVALEPFRRPVIDHAAFTSVLSGAHNPCGLKDLPIAELGAFGIKMFLQIIRSFRESRLNNRLESGILDGLPVAGREHPGSGNNHHIRHPVPFVECSQHRKDGGRFGLVPFGTYVVPGGIRLDPPRVRPDFYDFENFKSNYVSFKFEITSEESAWRGASFETIVRLVVVQFAGNGPTGFS